jgi:hypothetical protein
MEIFPFHAPGNSSHCLLSFCCFLAIMYHKLHLSTVLFSRGCTFFTRKLSHGTYNHNQESCRLKTQMGSNHSRIVFLPCTTASAAEKIVQFISDVRRSLSQQCRYASPSFRLMMNVEMAERGYSMKPHSFQLRAAAFV